ncbi:MAG: hypothetical protein RMI90_00330 [Thermoguttaceae bacterium]|nr:hypothetical protein [Thermoguttaceae bacterium]
MAQAVLMTKNVIGSSHKEVIRLFGEHFGKPHVFDAQIAKSLVDAYRKRLAGDYAIGSEIT